MHRQNLFDRLYFDDYALLDNDIGPVSPGQPKPTVDQRQLDLPPKQQGVQRHLMAQTFLINLLKKSWSNRPMNLDRQTNHPPGQIPRGQTIHRFSASSETSAPSVIHGTIHHPERPHSPPENSPTP
jgi:hypothetical protein